MTKPMQEALEMILEKASSIEVKEMVSNLAMTLEKEVLEAQHRGREEGKKEGRKEGKKEGKKEVAKSMLINDMDVELVTKLTGLPREVVKKIKTDITH